ncbi:hypothetical protein D7X88_04525 [bacterium C-53]|nr:hypothetical protein [Lachnospiraceae bacterium]NBI02491.1 hypothetical protein [Lachnospiraceae bacterium]RKJ11586.1 hypothetical protein D7X88_04525 [bacterium C-53]
MPLLCGQMEVRKEMQHELESGELFYQTYGESIRKLSRYIPWLTGKSGDDVSHKYSGEYGESAIAFPVFDSTLMNFLKEARETNLIDRNYPYAYTGRSIRTKEAEERAIEDAWLRDVDFLRGVFSKYVLEGMTKSNIWAEAVERKIFLNVLCKLKEIAEYYHGPLGE